MENVVINLNSFNLNLIKTDKFRSIQVAVIFENDIVKEDITKLNVLADLLIYSSKNYDTRRKIILKLQDLYGLSLSAYNNRIGKSINTTFTINMLEEKYTEKGMFEESIKLLSEVIFNPNLKNNAFDSKSFSIVKEYNRASIKSFRESKARYAVSRMLENMSNEQYSYNMNGYLEDLEKIDEKNLYEFYEGFLNKSIVNIYVVGNIDIEEITSIIKKYFIFKTIKKHLVDVQIVHNKYRKSTNSVVELDSINQSKLVIGCKIKPLSDFEYKYVSNIFSRVLGGGSNSLLFSDVREKNSFCYFINSEIEKSDSLLMITSFIDAKNYKKVISLIKGAIKKIKTGEFNENIINNAIEGVNYGLKSLFDSMDGIIAFYYGIKLLNLDDIDDRLSSFKTVTKNDLMAFAKKINIDTIYFLKGDKEHE